MDPSFPHDNAEPDEHILALVNEYLDRRQAGEDITSERFLAKHSDVAEELRPYLAGLPLIDTAFALGEGVADEVTGAATELPSIEGYKLIEEIGRGGMGIVYQALQVSTKRIVALKVMLAGPFATPATRRRFDREVELAARLEHSSIVRIIEGGEVAGQRYYTMGYVAGVRLNRYLSMTQPNLHTTLKLFVRICEAVDYAHGHGVVHRDLKPANILVDDEGCPHILDFGLAKATDQAEAEEALTTYVSLPGQVLGTLLYLSPEQAAGTSAEVDPRTDVYALGVVLFEALTGSLPFDTTGPPSQVIQRILETAPRSPRSLSEHVDSELETIILKALEKEKSRRYQSAKEISEDLRRYLEGEPILARRPSSLYVVRKKLHKHRWAVAFGVMAVALILVGLQAQAWWRARELTRAHRYALHAQQALESRNPFGSGMVRVVTEQHSQLPEAALVRAQLLYRTGQQYAAIGILQDVLKTDPSAWACRALLAELHQAAGEVELAGELRTRAEREAPDTAEAWSLRSFAALDLQCALRYARQVVQRQPAHVLAWERLTRLCLEVGDLDGALRGADELLKLGEDAQTWDIFKGRVLARQGRFREAIEEFTRTVRYEDRAHAYRRVKEYDKAISDYTRLLKQSGESPHTTWCLYQRATPLWILGRTDEALEDYRRVRSLLGYAFYSDARRFLILREQDRRDDAEQVLAAALRDVEDHWLRQIFRCLAGELTPDELVADGIARNDPQQLCEAYYYAGEVCLLLNRRAEARGWFEQCVQTGVAFDPDAAFGTPMNEYELAQWRLDTLFADQNPTSRP